MRNLLKKFISFFLAILAFVAGYKATDWFFRREIIPYPFEFFGILTGLALASWTLAVLTFITKRRTQ